MEQRIEMPARAELKQKAKERFAGRRGACIVVICITWLIPAALIALVMILLVALGAGNLSRAHLTIIALPIAVFAQSLFAECAYFYLAVYRGERVTAGEFFAGVWQKTGRKIGGMLWYSLAMGAWALLVAIVAMVMTPLLNKIVAPGFFTRFFVLLIIYVPLIIKRISYGMHVFMLRDCPAATVRECLDLSGRMMKGNKRGLFVLLLSFAGWVLLAMGPVCLVRFFMPESVVMLLLGMFIYIVVACGYVAPYLLIVLAGFYDELKRASIVAGVIPKTEIGRSPAYMRERKQSAQAQG